MTIITDNQYYVIWGPYFGPPPENDNQEERKEASDGVEVGVELELEVLN